MGVEAAATTGGFTRSCRLVDNCQEGGMDELLGHNDEIVDKTVDRPESRYDPPGVGLFGQYLTNPVRPTPDVVIERLGRQVESEITESSVVMHGALQVDSGLVIGHYQPEPTGGALEPQLPELGSDDFC